MANDLARAAIPEAQLKAELLVADMLGIHHLELPVASVPVVPPDALARIEAGAARLAAGEPLQYVTGWTSFLGHRIVCDKRALIPRPETEELVELVLQKVGRGSHTAPPSVVRIVDVGTGTGCIAIALKLALPEAEVIATDMSIDALNLALENAAALGAAVSFVRDDLVEGQADGSIDVLVSNPPYVGTDEMAGLERAVRDFEPRSALDGGVQGLDIIRRLVSKGWKKLKPGGRLFLEIGEAQGPAVQALLVEQGFADVEIRKDVAGNDRMVAAIKKETSTLDPRPS
jgi:release factor glutamine methyltransferase